MSIPTLSKRAIALLHRLYDGKFYKADARSIPKAMQELIDAKLVTTGGRVQTIVRCYVPAKGFKGFTLDEMPPKPKWMTPKSPPPKRGLQPEHAFDTQGFQP